MISIKKWLREEWIIILTIGSLLSVCGLCGILFVQNWYLLFDVTFVSGLSLSAIGYKLMPGENK